MSSSEAAVQDAGVVPGGAAVGSAGAPGAAAGEPGATPSPMAAMAAGCDAAGSAEEELFYASLAATSEHADVVDVERHALVPSSMLLVRTRVLGVPRAIEAGRYHDVNALAVATIVALCNAMRELEIPFSFEGDGATLLVPGSRRLRAERALRGVRAMARSAFELELRASIIPLTELRDAGHEARVARFRSSPHARLAAFSGDAFGAAERWLKDPERAARYELGDGESEADFEGFECRWQPQESQRGHVVSLLVRALAPSVTERTQTYRNLLRAFDRIVDTEACHPLKPADLQLESWLGDYSVEARVRAQGTSGTTYAAARRNARKQTLLGKLLAASGIGGGFDGRRYKRELVENCDYRRFDDGLRMVVDLNVAEIYRLESRLSAEHRAGRLAYGLHRSNATRLTCFVRSYTGGHLHFVDGTDGGYALAARELEAQLEALALRASKGPEPRPYARAARPPA